MSSCSAYYSRHGSESQQDQQAREQGLAEMQRRDTREARRETTEERRRARWSAWRADRDAVIESEFLQAEVQTQGEMLNRRGVEADINPRSLLTGPERRVKAYANDELLDYFDQHARPTEAYFQGYDTRLGRSPDGPVRSRMSAGEQEWRDRYERDVTWPVEVGTWAEAAA